MFINEESLTERLNLSNRTLDELKFKRDHSIEKIDVESLELERVDSTPLRGDAGLEIVTLPKRGRIEGYKNMTEAQRTVIGIESRILGQTGAAKANNVSQAFAGLCEKGKINTDASSPINETRLDKVNTEVNKLRSKALEGLHSSVGILNGKLSDSMKVNDAIGVASTLVKIVSISTPEEKKDQASRLIIMAPQMREERLYEVIDVG